MSFQNPTEEATLLLALEELRGEILAQPAGSNRRDAGRLEEISRVTDRKRSRDPNEECAARRFFGTEARLYRGETAKDKPRFVYVEIGLEPDDFVTILEEVSLPRLFVRVLAGFPWRERDHVTRLLFQGAGCGGFDEAEIDELEVRVNELTLARSLPKENRVTPPARVGVGVRSTARASAPL